MGITTGIKYLDQALGGYPSHNVLVEHDVGAGGTILGMHYLRAGLLAGEKVGALLAGSSVESDLRKIGSFGLAGEKDFSVVRASSDPTALFEALEKEETCLDRLLIDSLSHVFIERGLGGIGPDTSQNAVRVKKFLSDMTLNPERYCGHVMALLEYKLVNPEILLFLEESFEGVLRLEVTRGRFRVMNVVKWPWNLKRRTFYYNITRKGFVFK